MKQKIAGVILIVISLHGFGQKSDKLPRFFGNPIISDSSSTILIPIRYNPDFLESSKIAFWNDYYANILFYDFTTDSSKRLFQSDTFIKGFSNEYSSYYGNERANKLDNKSTKWIFYFVKTTDFDENGRVDDDDPSILFVSDKFGNNLKPLTPSNENAVSIDVFDKQGFALIKMQRDFDKDNDFESNDKDFYYIRLDLTTLTLGKKQEIK